MLLVYVRRSSDQLQLYLLYNKPVSVSVYLISSFYVAGKLQRLTADTPRLFLLTLHVGEKRNAQKNPQLSTEP